MRIVTAAAFREYDRDALDRQYSPSTLVPDLQSYLDEYALLSAAARRTVPVHTDLQYGPEPVEVLDFFPAAAPGAPLHVFVHGGNWQLLTKDESAFPAPAFVAAGSAFAAVGYGLAPDYPLDEIVAMVRRAVRWLHGQADELGFDPRRVHVSGTSAGAHLAAMALAADDGSGADPSAAPVGGIVAGAVLLSGIYDLEPVRHSYVNDALRLDDGAVRRNSPLRVLPKAATAVPLVVARGGGETAEYARQHDEMVRATRRFAPVVEVVSDGRNHFDLPYDLADPDTGLGAAVFAQMGLRLTGAVL